VKSLSSSRLEVEERALPNNVQSFSHAKLLLGFELRRRSRKGLLNSMDKEGRKEGRKEEEEDEEDEFVDFRVAKSGLRSSFHILLLSYESWDLALCSPNSKDLP
jgi:hypothetical protein